MSYVGSLRKKWATIAIKILGSLNDNDIEMVDSCVQKMIDFRQVAIEIWILKFGFIPILEIFFARLGVHIKIVDGFASENLEIVRRDRF